MALSGSLVAWIVSTELAKNDVRRVDKPTAAFLFAHRRARAMLRPTGDKGKNCGCTFATTAFLR
jgi:hypothetical protein